MPVCLCCGEEVDVAQDYHPVLPFLQSLCAGVTIGACESPRALYMLRLAIVVPIFAQSLLLAQNQGEITGTVTDSFTHQPIPKVHVSCAVGSQFVGSLTGVDGAYTLEDVPAGPVRMTVNLDGYRTIDPNSEQSLQFPLAAGDAIRRDFELHPLGRIYGTLVDRDTGKPIQGHTVSAVTKEYDAGQAFLLERAAEQSGDGFNIRNLEPGDYAIRIDPVEQGKFVFPAGSAPKPSPQECFGRTWYPGVPRIEMAALIHVGEGEARGLEISLQSREMHSLSGTVKTPREFEGKPVTFVLQTSAMQGSVGVMPTPGAFRIDNLAPGNYRLALTGGLPPTKAHTLMDYILAEGEAFRAAGSVSAVAGDYEFEITDHDIDDFKAALEPYAGVSGEVRMLEKDAKLPGKLGIGMMPTGDGPIFMRGAGLESGRFHQDSLRPGEYWPQLFGLPDGYAVAQVLFEGSSPRNTTISLNAPDTPLTFVITSRPGAVAGVVRREDQTPVRGASVVLLPDPLPDKPARGVIRVKESAEDGTFLFKDLAPGKYRALVVNGSDLAHEGGAGYLREQAARADAFEVLAGRSVTVNLKW
jgi:hypothetical protein